MFRSADINALRESLPELDFRSHNPLPATVRPYLDYYGLSGENIFPRQNAASVHVLGAFSCAGFRIACHYFSPPPEQVRGTAFIVHGYYDHAGLYGHLIKYCLQRNLAVVIFDLPGHGLSSGERVSIESFAQYREVFNECLRLAHKAGLSKPWLAIGQSTGSTIIMDYSLANCEQSSRFEHIVLLAPLVRPYQWWRGSALHTVLAPFVKTIKRNFVVNSSNEEFLRFVRESDPLQSQRLSADWVGALKRWLLEFERYNPCEVPVSVVQGAMDTTVDWRYNLRAIERKFPHASTYMIADARHHLVNETQGIRQRLYSILDAILD
ncbi:MAG: alpha/beta hydrolase [Pseudomonadota bacterium]